MLSSKMCATMYSSTFNFQDDKSVVEIISNNIELPPWTQVSSKLN